MSEIEKMYENAEIKPTKNWQSCLNCKLKTEKFRDEWGEEYLTCINFETPEKCSNAKKYYPPFTSEKQIELIKWLIVHSPSICLEDEIIVSAFEDSLANIINTLWQDLNEEERKQIQETLK